MFKKLNSFGISIAVGLCSLIISTVGGKYLSQLGNNHLFSCIAGYFCAVLFGLIVFTNLYRWFVVYNWKHLKLNAEWFGLRLYVLLIYLLLKKVENLPEKFNPTIKPKLVSKLEQEDFEKDCKLSDVSLFLKYMMPAMFAVLLVGITKSSPTTIPLIAFGFIFIANGISKLGVFEFKKSEVVSKENN